MKIFAKVLFWSGQRRALNELKISLRFVQENIGNAIDTQIDTHLFKPL